MSIREQVIELFEASIETKHSSKEQLATPIASAVEQITAAFKAGNKILSCGNGGSAADAQHFSAELVCRFEIERPGLPAVALTTDTSALTAISNDYAYDEVFAKQVNALANLPDINLNGSCSTPGRLLHHGLLIT